MKSINKLYFYIFGLIGVLVVVSAVMIFYKTKSKTNSEKKTISVNFKTEDNVTIKCDSSTDYDQKTTFTLCFKVPSDWKNDGTGYENYIVWKAPKTSLVYQGQKYYPNLLIKRIESKKYSNLKDFYLQDKNSNKSFTKKIISEANFDSQLGNEAYLFEALIGKKNNNFYTTMAYYQEPKTKTYWKLSSSIPEQYKSEYQSLMKNMVLTLEIKKVDNIK